MIENIEMQKVQVQPLVQPLDLALQHSLVAAHLLVA